MPKPSKPLRQIWAEPIHTWLTAEPVDVPWSEKEKHRRLRVATDPRLLPVARKLEQLAYGEYFAEHLDDVYHFLDTVIWLPDIWQSLSDQPKDFRKSELLELQRTAESFLTVLNREPSLVWNYLAPSPIRTMDDLAKGRDNYLSLVQMVGTIHANAEQGHDVFSPSDIPKLSRKNSSSFTPAQQIFCVKELTASARKLFNNPLHPEVALLVTVCLDLKVPIRTKLAKERSRRR